MQPGYDPNQDLVTLAEIPQLSAADLYFQKTVLNTEKNYGDHPALSRTNYFHQSFAHCCCNLQ